MLISRVSEGHEAGVGESREISTEEDHTHEYQTASELFEIMARDHTFDTNGDDPLTTRDLVILYKNIDVGTKLMRNANEIKLKKPNQYVETVIYKEDPESDGSEISEIYSREDLNNIFIVNKERIDLLHNRSSLENTLCHKFGDIEIQSSELTTEYDKHFLFHDPYIQEQLNSFKLNSNVYDGTILPTSLLDYICCKRLEDNYNFYMDNIIRYVKHTIEQLKRISNGDYLTDKAKEKWKEVKNISEMHDSKILATSTSIPLHVEQKTNGYASTWDDIVHSEVDVRSLSKILEKKIVVEVPKLICGSYRLFSTRGVNNLLISCKRDSQSIIKKGKHDDSRVDVVLQLERSQTGQVISNISSIMILQASPNIQEPLPLPYNEIEDSQDNLNINNVKIVEIDQDYDENLNAQPTVEHNTLESNDNYFVNEETHEDSAFDTNDYPGSENDLNTSKNYSCVESSESSDALRDIIDKQSKNQGDALFNVISPDELRLTIQRLNIQTSLPEESAEEMSLNTNTINKKKSPTRVRIKSPYENKSYILEEKKRKKLLEIREKREKKKQASGENCKVTKHKYGKSAIMPQPSSSVTKLSITNKSFYNSIYGQAIAIENSKPSKGKGTEPKVPANKGPKNVSIPEIFVGENECEQESPALTPEKNNKKYINRSYYLDDAETEMMYIPMKTSENDDPKDISASISAVSNEFRANLTLLSQLISSSTTDVHDDEETNSPSAKSQRLDPMVRSDANNGNIRKNIDTSQCISNLSLSENPENVSLDDKYDNKKKIVPSISSVECRKSIEKIYELMNKLGKVDVVQIKGSTSKTGANVNKPNVIGGRESSTFQASDSGTSLKHHLNSSNPSCFSFGNNITKILKTNIVSNKTTENPVVPKVIISTKSQIPKIDCDKNKRFRRTSINPHKLPENPLKAISQFLHEFDSVQKVRQKAVDAKVIKKTEGASVARCASRQPPYKRRSRFDQHIKDNEMVDKATKFPTPRRPKVDMPKIPHQHIIVDDKTDKLPKRKIIADILDEVKEARGEAVRGPSKFTSRLNTLAQPKRSYVQAHSEEYQTRYGRNLMADRLQRLAALPLPPTERTLGSANSRNKLKRSGTEALSAVSIKSPPASPLDILERARRRSASSSPVGKRQSPAGRGKQNVNHALDTIKTVVDLEPYVKSQHRRASPTVRRSRVPLLPSDMEICSLTSANNAEESTELGSTLHRMVDAALGARATPPSAAAPLHALPGNAFPADNLSRPDERMSVDSDYSGDIFGDKNVVTAVENIERKHLDKTVMYELQPFNSLTEIEKLEIALHRRLSVGTFQKKLRITNMTLTPQQSMSQLFVVQGGDADSIIAKSTVSRNLKIRNSDKCLDLKALPVLSRTCLDWTFADFPVQIATVGCAFPQYHSVQCKANTKISLLNIVTRSSAADNNELIKKTQMDKVSQCFKGNQQKPSVEQSAQVNALQEIIQSKEPLTTQKEDIDTNSVVNKNNKSSDAMKINTKEVEIINEEVAKDNSQVELPKNTVDYTTSLDMLVGLLNEIQKITTCQTNITNAESDFQCKNIESVLNVVATSEHCLLRRPIDIMSITSLDKLRKLESNPSLYTLYLSSDGETETDSPMIFSDVVWKPGKPVCDKEVNVDFADREYVNNFTEVPSIFPITLNRSSNVTDSLIGLLSEPSSQSMYSFVDHGTLYSNTSLNPLKTIIQLPRIELIENDSQQYPAPYRGVNKGDIENFTKKEPTPTGENETEQNHTSIPEVAVGKNTISTANKREKAATRKNLCNVVVKTNYRSDFDPLLKMKREILVTVYSILVFTVFAALSFPQVLYQV